MNVQGIMIQKEILLKTSGKKYGYKRTPFIRSI